MVHRVPQPQGISSIIFIFVTVTRFAITQYGMYHLNINIYTYGDTGITAMDSATGSIYLEDPGVDRHHLIIPNTHSIFPRPWCRELWPSFHRSTQFVWFLTHFCQAFIDPRNMCGSSWPGVSSYPFTFFLRCSRQNRSVSQIPFGCHVRCGRVLMIGCLSSSSSISPHHDQVNLETHSEAMIE